MVSPTTNVQRPTVNVQRPNVGGAKSAISSSSGEHPSRSAFLPHPMKIRRVAVCRRVKLVLAQPKRPGSTSPNRRLAFNPVSASPFSSQCTALELNHAGRLSEPSLGQRVLSGFVHRLAGRPTSGCLPCHGWAPGWRGGAPAGLHLSNGGGGGISAGLSGGQLELRRAGSERPLKLEGLNIGGGMGIPGAFVR